MYMIFSRTDAKGITLIMHYLGLQLQAQWDYQLPSISYIFALSSRAKRISLSFHPSIEINRNNDVEGDEIITACGNYL